LRNSLFHGIQLLQSLLVYLEPQIIIQTFQQSAILSACTILTTGVKQRSGNILTMTKLSSCRCACIQGGLDFNIYFSVT
jgi:hypothetical protein